MMIFSPVSLGAATVTWTGNAGTNDWNTAENWDVGIIVSLKYIFITKHLH
ncbi:MAG: hypothetical protein AB8H03_24685 [Saprospiraceae bacterium]